MSGAIDTAVEPITSEAELRELLGQPSERALKKQLPGLDAHARAFLAKAPFCALATSGRDGSCDASPRGEGPGFALVLGDRLLAIPDRPGNRRFDSVRNILENPAVGLLFMVPGMEETLRVNGRARLVKDAPWFAEMIVDGKRPTLAILVEVEEVFFHCAKAFRRSRLWEPETWPARDELPTLGRILKDQVGQSESVAELDCALEETYAKTMF